MPLNNVMPVVDDDVDKALDLIAQLKTTQTASFAALNAHANTASAANDTALDIALTRKAVALSRENLRIANARRAAKTAKSLAGPIEELKRITREAESAREDLNNIANALRAAERLIGLFSRLTGLFR
jgi:hypothetical protein